MIKIIEECRVSPAPGTVTELTLPLTFFDVYWGSIRNILRPLVFYKIPLITKTSFIETFIPNLKKSLSLALKHYLPLAGNLVWPLQEEDSVQPEPVLRYVSGSGIDYVPLIFAESLDDEEFGRLAGNQPRKCVDFYHLIPVLKPPVVSTNSKITPLLAVQVTLFPNSGISIGLALDHVTADGNVMVGFLKAWASINKFDRDSQLLEDGLIPFYDRSLIKDPYELKTGFLKHSKPDSESSQVSSLIPTNKVRATFVLPQSKIEELKKHVLRNGPSLTHVSSFTITCAYIWTCLSKAKDEFVAHNNVKDREEEIDFFNFAVDCRSRLDPPLPAAYFGNCIVPCCVGLSHEELVGKDGFLVASEKIGAAIHEFDNEGILNNSHAYKLLRANPNRMTSVTGTNKNNFYEADFGWGKPQNIEAISIDIDKVDLVSLNQSGREETGLEVGLSLPEKLMDAFATIFAAGIDKTQSSQEAEDR